MKRIFHLSKKEGAQALIDHVISKHQPDFATGYLSRFGGDVTLDDDGFTVRVTVAESTSRAEGAATQKEKE